MINAMPAAARRKDAAIVFATRSENADVAFRLRFDARTMKIQHEAPLKLLMPRPLPRQRFLLSQPAPRYYVAAFTLLRTPQMPPCRAS